MTEPWKKVFGPNKFNFLLHDVEGQLRAEHLWNTLDWQHSDAVVIMTQSTGHNDLALV